MLSAVAFYIICENEFLRPFKAYAANDWLFIIFAGEGEGDPAFILRELLNIANCWDVRKKLFSRYSKSMNLSTDFFFG